MIGGEEVPRPDAGDGERGDGDGGSGDAVLIYITAAEIARQHGIDPKRYGQALRDAAFSWYVWGTPWTVVVDSPQHNQLMAVMVLLTGRNQKQPLKAAIIKVRSGRAASDESYILDLCDEVIGVRSVRQHRFDFLLGDPGFNGRRRMLPVDAWYPDQAIVIEYRERQHSEKVDFFDRRSTVSGMGRGEQRKRYDQLRREVLPAHGINLIEFDFFSFKHHANRRLFRCEEDRTVISERLNPYIN